MERAVHSTTCFPRHCGRRQGLHQRDREVPLRAQWTGKAAKILDAHCSTSRVETFYQSDLN